MRAVQLALTLFASVASLAADARDPGAATRPKIDAAAISRDRVARAADRAVPAVRVLIKKGAHEMVLYAPDGAVLARYTVSVGSGGLGPKRHEGDRVTPTGRYHVVDRSDHGSGSRSIRGPFLLLDYPSVDDRARFAHAKRRGAVSPRAGIGHSIGIHGGTKLSWQQGGVFDWTRGCLALTDSDMRTLFDRVADGAVVDIED